MVSAREGSMRGVYNRELSTEQAISGLLVLKSNPS